MAIAMAFAEMEHHQHQRRKGPGSRQRADLGWFVAHVMCAPRPVYPAPFSLSPAMLPAALCCVRHARCQAINPATDRLRKIT